MLIEFMGLPGSGKTHIATQLCRTLQQRSVPVAQHVQFERSSRPRRLWRKARTIATGWRTWVPLVYPFLRFVNARDGPTTLSKVRLALNWFHTLGVVHRAGAVGSSHVLDQGPFQAIWALSTWAPGALHQAGLAVDQLVHVTIRAMRHHEDVILVVVRADAETRMQRLSRRGHIGATHGGDEPSGGERGAEALAEIVDSLRTVQGVSRIGVREVWNGAEGIDMNHVLAALPR